MSTKATSSMLNEPIEVTEFRNEVLNDYRIACESRETSLLGRKEVLTGKAKFGIFGDGKEVAQIAMAKQFNPGDFRAGYYRDQTFMMAAGLLTIEQFFAQLYAHADVQAEPASAGRSMNGHYATRTIDENGQFKRLSELKNVSADISPTAGQMPRLLGLAYASKLYRNLPDADSEQQFSVNGNEVAFGTIGDASTSEGLFFEAINAAGVLQVPMAISIWDDGYGISVPREFQTTKGSISKALSGMKANEDEKGYLIYTAKGWDYAGLCKMYKDGVAECRQTHSPVLFHITEMTQPQGHSTSGSHERYKSKERLQWEQDFDCIKKMREWILSKNIAEVEVLDQIEQEAKQTVKDAKNSAWQAFQLPIQKLKNELIEVLTPAADVVEIQTLVNELKSNKEPLIRDVLSTARKAMRYNTSVKSALKNWIEQQNSDNYQRFNSDLFAESAGSALYVESIQPDFDGEEKWVDGREIIRDNFDYHLANNPKFVTFGEDSGNIGGVNQTLEGMQKKYGNLRVSDTGIREATIVGQGIGLAMRGFRPVAEIQYLDYLLYAIQIMSDDLATLRYRTKSGQKAPLIVATRGHRLEGIWHSGSPMGMIINAIRGMHVCVPRNMTQAAGFYNTLLAADDPGLIIEPLNGYRTKELQPKNIGLYRTPLGKIEILNQGNDLTIVTYGSNCRLAQEAVHLLAQSGISAELIDIQTLLPFDLNHEIAQSLKKTNKLLVIDEDVPGGASAYILQQILEVQQGYKYLDAAPVTLSAKAHRPAYGSDGDYFSKPSVDDMFETAYNMMNEYNPAKFPSIY